MPRIEPELQRLQEIKTLPSLIKYLKDDLNWPIESEDVENVTFDYDPAELGFDSASTAKIEEVRQLRPLTPGQKWGVFWGKFGKKQLPVQMLRRALGNLVVKKRASTKKSDKAAWHMHDLLFISAYGDDSNRHITFAHFSESEDSEKTLPVLKVLGWDDDDTVLHLKDTYKTLLTTLNWDTTPTNDAEAWREQWSSAFKLKHHEVINTTKELVVKLAQLATVIKKSVLTSIKAETEKGPWRKLMLAFQKTLIKDLDEDQFADVIAQTVSYGLLTARLSSDGQISLKNLVDMVPSTNPFLKELLQHFLTSAGMKGLFDVDEAGINDVVELLNRANAQAIRNDFGKKTTGEDPVIHFYEHFLGEYNKKLKVERGVFYTPQPVVSYIVRSAHELLQKEFGLEDGLADTSTWADVKKRHKGLKIPEGINPDIEPFVQILDPATGTATFLIEVIDVIHNAMRIKWDKERITKADQIKKWNTYVPTHLLPRLYAYELMMAPYAIAHMKVGLKLTETGFAAWDRLGPENRANIFLTNALEPWTKQLELPGFDALAHEAAAVNEVKKSKSFTVILGNPPYSNFGQLNRNPFILELLEEYKRGLDERKINLDDDFIKFMRCSQNALAKTGCGIMAMITNNVYLDGITHRQMRNSLITQFNDVSILDLHGNARKAEFAATGKADENVFDIMQGVAVCVLSRSPGTTASLVRVAHTQGTREEKYLSLSGCNNTSPKFTNCVPVAPYFMFKEHNDATDEYMEGTPISEIFISYQSPIQTKRDGLTIHFTKTELQEVLDDISSLPDAQIRKKYELAPDGRDWTLPDAKADIRSGNGSIIKLGYKPFDFRFTLYTGKSRGFLAYPRNAIMRHMLRKGARALVFKRQAREDKEGYTYFFTINCPFSEGLFAIDPRGREFIAPLTLIPDENESGQLNLGEDGERPNFTASFLHNLSSKLQKIQDKVSGLPHGLSQEDIFNYMYAVFNSPGYRTRYTEFLKIDFPRLPITGNTLLFKSLSKIGATLCGLHVLEHPLLEKVNSQYVGGRVPVIEKITWSKNSIWIDKDQTIGFTGIKEEVWDFHIGGYQVCEKWLKDRRGRKLSKDDIEHYQKIVEALSETIRLMAEIDKVIDEHGGWPGAFQATK
jgi:predicted helicase